MSDPFMTAIFTANKVKASARFKDTKLGVMKTVTLLAVPQDMTEDAFLEAAKQGVDLAAKSIGGDAERSRGINGKGVFGASASAAASKVLGYTAPTVPESVKARGRSKSPVVKPTDDDESTEHVGSNGFAKV